MLNKLEPDKAMQPLLYNDYYHFQSPDVYHAFNWQLLAALPPPAYESTDAAFTKSSGCIQSMHEPFDSVAVASLTFVFVAFSAIMFA
jgi:hypothetical protein